jgi:hypothetical protein
MAVLEEEAAVDVAAKAPLIFLNASPPSCFIT